MCFKFRTMLVNAETSSHQSHLAQLMASGRPMNKLDQKGDQRLLPGSRIIRALGLDELPQLINVIFGDMSLVGPRPAVVYEYEQYSPKDRARCNTVPGLTGLWQVSGKNKTTFNEMVQLDLTYIKHKSLLLDVKIMALTIPVLLIQAWEMKFMRTSGHAGKALAAFATAGLSRVSDQEEVLAQAAEVLRQRKDKMGVPKQTITAQEDGMILIKLSQLAKIDPEVARGMSQNDHNV
jgi:hypothetical protein